MKVSLESRGGFDNALSWLKRMATIETSGVANRFADDGTRSLAANTPKDTGKTASGWKAKVTTKSGVTEIQWTNDAHPEARVNVAKIIELGHGTGTGGYVPPRPYIKKAMKPVWGNIDSTIVRELIK